MPNPKRTPASPAPQSTLHRHTFADMGPGSRLESPTHIHPQTRPQCVRSTTMPPTPKQGPEGHPPHTDASQSSRSPGAHCGKGLPHYGAITIDATMPLRGRPDEPTPRSRGDRSARPCSLTSQPDSRINVLTVAGPFRPVCGYNARSRSNGWRGSHAIRALSQEKTTGYG
jgi:hypothetical protein